VEEDPRILSRRLDSLLETYLGLLDSYTKLRAQLSQDLSAGFFALAQANRSSVLGPGRRYGQDGYDERMKALKSVRIDQADDAPRLSAESMGSQEKWDHKPTSESVTEDLTTSDGQGEEATPPPASEGTSKDDLTNTTPQTEIDIAQADPSLGVSNPPHNLSHLPPCYTYTSTATPTASKDPLRWYGILVPPPLRQCQTRFQAAVTSAIPDLLSTTSALNQTEAWIWDVRREMGISVSCEDSHGQEDDGVASLELGGPDADAKLERTTRSLTSLSLEKEQADQQPQILGPSPSQRKPSLLSSSQARPSEPRSRILKLD
jgi:hypothetical protein